MKNLVWGLNPTRPSKIGIIYSNYTWPSFAVNQYSKLAETTNSLFTLALLDGYSYKLVHRMVLKNGF